jgi:hypothetical protein
MDLTRMIEQYETLINGYHAMQEVALEYTTVWGGMTQEYINAFQEKQSDLLRYIDQLGMRILSELHSTPSYTFLRMADGAEMWFHTDPQREKAWILGQNDSHLAVLSIPCNSDFSSVFSA